MAGFPSSFVAFVIDEAPFFDAVTSTLPPRVRALHREDLHLTLAFLSGVSPERAHRAFEVVSAQPLSSIAIRLGAVVPMGPPERWTAMSALIDEGREAATAAMSAVCDLATDAAGVARETRPPVPHVTLARLHAKATTEERAAAVAWASSLSLDAPLTLSAIALYTGRSVRPPGQPAYEIVVRRSLG